jgi:hypothetical protein
LIPGLEGVLGNLVPNGKSDSLPVVGDFLLAKATGGAIKIKIIWGVAGHAFIIFVAFLQQRMPFSNHQWCRITRMNL